MLRDGSVRTLNDELHICPQSRRLLPESSIPRVSHALQTMLYTLNGGANVRILTCARTESEFGISSVRLLPLIAY